MNAMSAVMTDERESVSVRNEVSPATEAPEFSKQTGKIIAVTLLSGVLFLGVLAGWIWYSVYQYQNIF